MIKKIKSFFSTEILMLVPSIIVLASISIYPLIYMVTMSFKKFPLIPGQSATFIGLQNWIEMFSDPAIGSSWIVTLEYFVVALFLQLFLGIGISLLVDRLRRGKGLFTTLILTPMFMAPVLVGLLWRFLLHDSYGLYTFFVRQLGFLKDVAILGNVNTALPAIILMDTWEWTPLIAIIIIAGLQSLPIDVFEAASIDGASYWQKLFYITFPLLKPVLTVALLIRTMDIVRFYAKIMVTTSGGPADSTKILAIRIFESAFRHFRIGYASAIGLTLLFVSIVLGLIFVNYLGEEGEQ